jgi:nucleotide-binding universal stress UspA family protein
VLDGDVATVIAETAQSDDVHLLFVGSRGHGPVREALFGGVGAALMRCARCPLVIVPDGSQR